MTILKTYLIECFIKRFMLVQQQNRDIAFKCSNPRYSLHHYFSVLCKDYSRGTGLG